jgi:hypothetical protein
MSGMRFFKQIFKIRLIHRERFNLAGLIVFQMFCIRGFYGIVVLKEKAVDWQAGAEPVIAGIFAVMFLTAFGVTYWFLFKEKNFYLAGQYKKYEMLGNDSEISQMIELSGNGEYESTMEVIWKPGKEDIPREPSFRLASSRKGHYVKACIRMEIVSDNLSRKFIEFEQYPDERLNVGDNVVGKILDKVKISCKEKIMINVTSQIERHKTLVANHEEKFLIRIYHSLNLPETFQQIPKEIAFT